MWRGQLPSAKIQIQDTTGLPVSNHNTSAAGKRGRHFSVVSCWFILCYNSDGGCDSLGGNRACLLRVCWLWSRSLLLQTFVQRINFKSMCITLCLVRCLSCFNLSKCLCFERMANRAEAVELWSDCGRSSTGVGSPVWEGMLAGPGRNSKSAPAPPAALPEVRSHRRQWTTLSLLCKRGSRKEEKVADSNMTVSSNNKKPQQCAHTQAKKHMHTHRAHHGPV